MKNTRRPSMKMVVDSYSKRRGYMPKKESMSNELSSLTLEQKIVSSVVEKEASRSNSFLYSSCNFDPIQVDLQFSRLKAWICGELNDEVWHCELAALLCPMFCHLYLEMLRVVPRHEVAKFYKKHEGMFVGREEEIRELAIELAEVSSLEELDSKPLTRNFRMSQFHSVISPAAMNALQKYLAKENNIILLQLLHTWFNFEIMLHHYVLEQEEEPLLERKLDEKSDKLAMIHNTEYSEIQEMLKLKETIQWTQVNPIPLGPLKLYTLQNNGCKIGCAYISPSREQLAAGLKNEIKLWNLTPKRFLVTAPRRIHLACDPPSPPTDPQTFLSDRESVTMRGHTDLVNDVMFMSPSDSDPLLFSVSKDATMRVWNLYNNTCAAIYRGHAGGICSLAQSNYGLYIATGSQDRTVKLWTVDRVFHLRNMVGHELDVESVAFHPNGMYVMSGSSDKTVRMWDVNMAKMVRVFVGHKGPVRTIAFSPDGKFLASAGDDMRVKIWDLVAAKCITEFKGHTGPVCSLSWSNDSEVLASCGVDATVRIWNVKAVNLLSYNYSSSKMSMYVTRCANLLSVHYTSTNSLVSIGTETFPESKVK